MGPGAVCRCTDVLVRVSCATRTSVRYQTDAKLLLEPSANGLPGNPLVADSTAMTRLIPRFRWCSCCVRNRRLRTDCLADPVAPYLQWHVLLRRRRALPPGEGPPRSQPTTTRTSCPPRRSTRRVLVALSPATVTLPVCELVGACCSRTTPPRRRARVSRPSPSQSPT